MRRVSARPISRRLRAAAAVVVGRRHLLLDVGRQHDLLVVDLAAVDPALDEACSLLLREARLDVDLDLERLSAASDPLPQPARPRRGEIITAKVRGRAVLHALHVLRLVRESAPRHLVGRVEGLGPVGRRRQDAEGAALPDGLARGPRLSAPEASTILPLTSLPS